MRLINRKKYLVAAGLLCCAMTASAQAQDVDGALERFKTLMAEQGLTIDWENAQIAGGDATLVGVTAGTAEGSVAIGDLSLTGITETDIGHRVDSIELPYYQIGDGNGSLRAEDVSLSGVVLPAEGQQGPYGGFMFYEAATLRDARAVVGDTEVFSLTDLHIEIDDPQGGDTMDFSGVAEGFAVDLSAIEDPTQKAVVQALGYEQIEGYFEMLGSWNVASGDLEISQNDLTVVDAGTIGLTVRLGGYTQDFLDSLRRIQQQMAENPDQDSAAQGLAMMGLMQQLSFHRAEVAFLDDGLTTKVLDFVAQQQGMKPSDIVNQAKAVLPFVLAQLNNPELTAMATQAVSSFLDDPQSLRVTAEPDAAVPFASIMAGAMTTPQELTKTLAVSVAANE